RGWKRRIRQVDRWGEKIKQPYLDYFLSENGRHTYDRCYLYPFYTLDKRHPPLWFFKLIISKFILVFTEWEKTFDKLGVPFDLQIWLYDPSYIQSEIICYKMQERGEHMQLGWQAGVQKPFPYQKFASKEYDLNQFDWVLAEENNVIWDDDLDYAEFTLAEILADGYEKRELEDGQVYYTKRVGDEWIGRRKGKIDADSKSRTWSYQAPPS
ncbi:MAG: hypothetical protein ACXVB6_06520, partial [Mucilaginibacter sp.]